MSSCEVCGGAAFVNVEAVRYSADDDYLKPMAFCFEAVYCPKCGKMLKGDCDGNHDHQRDK